MSTNEKKGITVKIDAELHAEVRQYLEKHEMTMAEFVTLAFQVPEELFQKIKDYLQRNNMTQKEFVIGLIENEIERDLSQRADVSEVTVDAEEVAEEHTEQQEEAAVSDSESVSEGVEK